MKTWCSTGIVGLAVALPGAAWSQTTNALGEASSDPWAFSVYAYGYLVPDSRDYVNLNVTADRGWLHLEGRYNYEALDSGSLWVGYNFSIGDKLVFEITPMVGGVLGRINGVSPGYNLSLSYKRFTLSSQGEYFVDASDSAENFFYTWSELSYSPADWFRAGLVVQRTKAYQSDLDIQRGFLVGFTYHKVDFTTYVFNLGWTDPTIVLALGLNF
jgi:hypothetical protein